MDFCRAQKRAAPLLLWDASGATVQSECAEEYRRDKARRVMVEEWLTGSGGELDGGSRLRPPQLC
jgi:hypothetical protein